MKGEREERYNMKVRYEDTADYNRACHSGTQYAQEEDKNQQTERVNRMEETSIVKSTEERKQVMPHSPLAL